MEGFSGSEVTDTGEGTKDGVVGAQEALPKTTLGTKGITAMQGVVPVPKDVEAEKSEVANGPGAPATKVEKDNQPAKPLTRVGQKAMQGN